jgi:hypothetical protein
MDDGTRYRLSSIVCILPHRLQLETARYGKERLRRTQQNLARDRLGGPAVD